VAGAVASLTAWERAAYALYALFVLGALAFWPVVTRVDPRLAVACSPLSDVRVPLELMRRAPDHPVPLADGGMDPWGHEWWVWAYIMNPLQWPVDSLLFSLGPDGEPETDDDIGCWTARDHTLARVAPVVVLEHPATCLGALGVWLAAWTAVSRRWIRAPRSTVAHELVRASTMIALPWLAIVPWLMRPVPAIDEATFAFVVPSRVALALTWTALVFLPAFAWRLSRPRVDA
jgi:hypothetical protein